MALRSVEFYVFKDEGLDTDCSPVESICNTCKAREECMPASGLTLKANGKITVDAIGFLVGTVDCELPLVINVAEPLGAG